MKVVFDIFQLTTNRGRRAFFGDPQKNYSLIYEPGGEGFLAGIYASWGYFTAEVAHVSLRRAINLFKSTDLVVR
jgi:hypothetical protein